jgi:hypothetical protein
LKFALGEVAPIDFIVPLWDSLVNVVRGPAGDDTEREKNEIDVDVHISQNLDDITASVIMS